MDRPAATFGRVWFEDLTRYGYSRSISEEPPTLNTGWLENGHEFATGSVDDVALARLVALLKHGVTRLMRGRHPCDLCSPDDAARPWGHSEIRVVAADGTR